MKITGDAFAVVNAQYRFSIRSPIFSHTFFSIGISGNIPGRAINKHKPAAPIAAIKPRQSQKDIQDSTISDRDHDGIPDKEDLCPDEPGFISNGGCPVVVKKDTSAASETIETISGRLNLLARNINFELNSYIINTSSYTTLDSIGTLLNAYPKMNVEIAGFTDSIGTNDHNLKLSRQRAHAVLKYLLSKGVNKERLSAIGYGESRPIDTNNTEEGRALNRRVEFTISKYE